MKGRTLYSRLGADRKESDRYEGVWHGEWISFNRVYKGRRLTDEECRTLCSGGKLRFIKQNQGLSECELTIALEGREFFDSQGHRQIMVTIKPVNRSFDMVTGSDDGFDVQRADRLDYFSDDDDARVAAMLLYHPYDRISMTPTGKSLDTLKGNVPVYKVSDRFVPFDGSLDDVVDSVEFNVFDKEDANEVIGDTVYVDTSVENNGVSNEEKPLVRDDVVASSSNFEESDDLSEEAQMEAELHGDDEMDDPFYEDDDYEYENYEDYDKALSEFSVLAPEEPDIEEVDVLDDAFFEAMLRNDQQ